MKPSSLKPRDETMEFFRVNPAVLRRLPAVATRSTKRRTSKLSPKTTVLVLLALCAQVARRPKSELTITPASGEAMASVTWPMRMVEVLETLGYKRSGGDFAGSAWETVGAAVQQLTAASVQIAFKRPGEKWLEPASFRGPLVERIEENTLCLRGYSPPGDNYHVLIPRKLLALRPQLTELGTRLMCWLYARHRGRRFAGKLRHKWSLTVTQEVLVDARILRSKNQRRSVELARMREGFKNLERLGMLTVDGSGWPFRVHLSPEFFHQEVAHE